MISLCAIQTDPRHWVITTTEMRDKIWARYQKKKMLAELEEIEKAAGEKYPPNQRKEP